MVPFPFVLVISTEAVAQASGFHSDNGVGFRIERYVFRPSRVRKKAESLLTQEARASSFYTCEAMTNNRAEYSATFRRSNEYPRTIR